MFVLVPGKVDDPIHVKLVHKIPSGIPQCLALSYSWGAPTREAEILFNGKILKVTPNLVAALKRLRSSSSKKPQTIAAAARSIISQSALSSTEVTSAGNMLSSTEVNSVRDTLFSTEISSARNTRSTKLSSFVSTLLGLSSARHSESREILESPAKPVLIPEEIEAAEVKTGLFWVDAICINQEDLDERFFSPYDLIVPT